MEERRVRQDGPPLQCPRCGSHNTKFCYYNNYNTAQPRHFCRGCQRYWTHGGALRNIPAGGSVGRKRSRRIDRPSSSPGPSNKMPRIQTDQSHINVMEGSVLAASLNNSISPLGLIPPPPPPFFYSGDQGIHGLGFSAPVPTLQLFNNHSINGGFRGFHPFNSLMMPPLPLLHGVNLHQQVVLNGSDPAGPSNGGHNNVSTGLTAGEGVNEDGGHGDHQGLFMNQFLTRFGNEGGGGEEEARVTFNAGNNGANQNPQCHANSSTGTASSNGVTPAKFM